MSTPPKLTHDVLGLAEVVECGGRDARLWINRIANVESSDIGAFASERNRAIEPAYGAPRTSTAGH